MIACRSPQHQLGGEPQGINIAAPPRARRGLRSDSAAFVREPARCAGHGWLPRPAAPRRGRVRSPLLDRYRVDLLQCPSLSFVVKEARRRGLGRVVLTALEEKEARRFGYRRSWRTSGASRPEHTSCTRHADTTVPRLYDVPGYSREPGVRKVADLSLLAELPTSRYDHDHYVHKIRHYSLTLRWLFGVRFDTATTPLLFTQSPVRQSSHREAALSHLPP